MNNNEDNKTYYGHGTPEMYDDYMDFINYVFGFNGNSSDFKKLLPKIYRPEDEPSVRSFVATENGKLKAAIGLYDIDINVLGIDLHTRGVGNVAVHPYARSKGYMRRLLNDAVDEMISDGVDISALGGRRQRYNFFSYEKTGRAYSLTINSDNVRHTYGSNRNNTIEFNKITADNNEYLDKIFALYNAQPLHGVRDRNRLYDILTSWKYSVWCGSENGEFAGYALVNDSRVGEMVLTDKFVNRADEFVVALFDRLNSDKLTITLPEYEQKYMNKLCFLAEGYSEGYNESISVFNYEKVVDAFMKLKAYVYAQNGQKLSDGEFTVLVHGRAGDENLTLSVINGIPSAKRTDKEPQLEVDHLDAIRLFFSPYAPMRNTLDLFVRDVLPLPMYYPHTDAI